MVPIVPHMAAQFLFLSVVVTAALSFIAVMVWLGHRKKEREAFYRSETMKKIAESGSAAAAIEYVRETERIAAARTRGALKLAGLVTMSAGIGLMAFLSVVFYQKAAGLFLGLIPVLVGLALFAYGQFMSPQG
jgi:hypothetical protein